MTDKRVPLMTWDDLSTAVYQTYEEILTSHGKDITEFPVIAIIDGVAHTITGWRLGTVSIQLTTTTEGDK